MLRSLPFLRQHVLRPTLPKARSFHYAQPNGWIPENPGNGKILISTTLLACGFGFFTGTSPLTNPFGLAPKEDDAHVIWYDQILRTHGQRHYILTEENPDNRF